MGKVNRLLQACRMGLAAAFVAVAFPVAVFAAPGDVGPWQIDDVVSDNLAWTSAQAYNGYLYLVSGANDSVYTDTIYYAQLAGNGSIGPWATTANAPYSGSSISVTTYNGYMYYISGWNGVDITNDAYYAVINPDGTISNWTATTSTPDAWSGAAITAYNGYVYMLGGDNGSGYDDSVIFAPINPDGSLGSWTSTTLLPVALSGGGVLAYNDHIYYVGGSDGFRVATVYYAALNPDGTVGSWQTTTALPDERGDGGLVVHNGYLFLVGGYNDLGITNTVLAAPINANGTVGAWSTKSPMPDERALAGVASYNGFVYNLAGLDDSSLTNTAFYAALSGYDLPAVQPVSAIAATSTGTTIDVLKDATGNPDPNTLTIVSGPSHGSAQVLGGKIVYTSQSGYLGSDSLTYQVCSLNDATICSQEVLSIQVVPQVPSTGIAPAAKTHNNPLALLTLLALGVVGEALRLKVFYPEL